MKRNKKKISKLVKQLKEAKDEEEHHKALDLEVEEKH